MLPPVVQGDWTSLLYPTSQFLVQDYFALRTPQE